MRPRSGIIALVVLVVAAFGGSLASSVGAQEQELVYPLAFSEPVVLPGSDDTSTNIPATGTCGVDCGEPMLAVGPDEELWVSAPRALIICCNGKASPLWKSTDGGITWDGPIFPGSPAGAWDALTGADTSVVVDKRGVVYVSELWAGNDTMFVSQTGGSTWISSPAHHAEAIVDREWLVYSPAEDALYGLYNSSQWLSLVKAELDGPLGPLQALMFPEQHLLVRDARACVPGVACLPPDQAHGLENGRSFGPPALLAVDQNDGTLFVPYHTDGLGEGIRVLTSEDGGDTWRNVAVPGSGMVSPVRTYNIFAAASVDEAGNAYVSWSEVAPGAGHTVFLSSSTDKGGSWSEPIPVSAGVSGTAIFPTIVAGADGRVAVGWYGTGEIVDPNAASAGTSWDVEVALSIDATAEAPSFEVATVDAGFHRGPICISGASCAQGTRKLLDFFDLDVEPSTGAVLAVYTRDKDTGTELPFARQSDGCSLTRPGENLGPGIPAPTGTPPTVC